VHNPAIYAMTAPGCVAGTSRFASLQLALSTPLAVVVAWLAAARLPEMPADGVLARNRLTRMLMQVISQAAWDLPILCQYLFNTPIPILGSGTYHCAIQQGFRSRTSQVDRRRDIPGWRASRLAIRADASAS